MFYNLPNIKLLSNGFLTSGPRASRPVEACVFGPVCGKVAFPDGGRRRANQMRKTGRTKALYAGSFDPITRGHLDIIGKALMTFDAVHVAIGTNVKKQRAFGLDESLQLIVRSIAEHWPEAIGADGVLFEGSLEVGEYTNQSLIAYARRIGATHIVRGLREASNFTEEFNLHGVAGRIDPTIPMVHFICEAQFLHVSSSTAKELDLMGESIGWLVTPSVEAAFAARRALPGG
jgi:pantetheine-phosphate adenylyltransferase